MTLSLVINDKDHDCQKHINRRSDKFKNTISKSVATAEVPDI